MSNAAAESIEQVNDDDSPTSDDKTKAEVVEVAKSDVIDNKEQGEDNEVTGDARSAIYDNYERNRGKPAEEAKAEEIKPEDQEIDAPELANDEPEMTKVKINGEERLVEKAKVDKAGGVVPYQKLIAAEEKMATAAQNQKILDEEATRLQEREAALDAREKELSQRDAPKQTQNDLPEKLDGDQKQALAAKVKAHREALMEGEDEKADEIMLEIMDMARTSDATNQNFLDETSDKAAQKALQSIDEREFERERVSGVDKFNTDYEDIATNPQLRAMADARSAEIYAEHPDWNPGKIILQAAEDTREWLQELRGDTTGGESPTQADSQKQRLEDKRSISTPSSASGRSTPKPAGPKVESNSDYIARLRKERGLE